MEYSIKKWGCFKKGFYLVFIYILFSTLGFSENILVVDSYATDFDWVVSYRNGIKDAIRESHIIDFFEMNTKRLPTDMHLEMANKAIDRFNNSKPDLVILADDNANKLVGTKLIKTEIPIVFLGVNENPRVYYKNLGRVSGVLERPLLKRSVIFISEIIESPTKKILIVFDDSPTATAVFKNDFNNKNRIDISVDIVSTGSWDKFKDAILTSKDKGYGAVIVGLAFTLKDSQGKIIHHDVAQKWASKKSPIPPFAFWDNNISYNKAIGGLVIDPYNQGFIAGKISMNILSGDQKNSRIVTDTNGKFMFSETQLRKHNIKLPSHIKNIALIVE